MIAHTRRYGLVAILLVVAMSACRTPVEPWPRYPGIEARRLDVDDARASRALTTHLERAAKREALRGTARVAVERPDLKLNRPQRIVVERPDRLRFEVLGLFDQLVGLLVSNGREFGYFEAGSGRVARAAVGPALLWERAGIDLDPHEVVELLLGAPKPSAGIARAGVWLAPDGTLAVAFAWASDAPPAACEGAADAPRRLFEPRCFVEPRDLEDGGELFYFDPAGDLRELRSLGDGGVLRYAARFDAYEPIPGGLRFPMRLSIRMPELASEAEFRWKRVGLAEDLPDTLFELPAGLRTNE